MLPCVSPTTSNRRYVVLVLLSEADPSDPLPNQMGFIGHWWVLLSFE